MLRWYQAKLKSTPVLTQSLTTLVLFATGDIMAQQGVEKVGVKKHNWNRTGRMAFYGGAIFGPAATHWYRLLARINIPIRSPSPLLVNTTARVAADQAVFAPINLALFLGGMAWMEGADVKQRLEGSWYEALRRNWIVWPAVQAVNLSVVPGEWRVGVVNVVALGWNCYLSYLNSQGGKKQGQDVKKE
jgi:protein Mpv17